MKIFRTRHNRILSTCLLLGMTLAFMVKAAIPAGFMPNEDMTAMVICSGMGEKTVMVPADEGQNDKMTKACAYDLATSQKILDVTLPALPLIANPPAEPVAKSHEIARVEAPVKTSLARGPPLFV